MVKSWCDGYIKGAFLYFFIFSIQQKNIYKKNTKNEKFIFPYNKFCLFQTIKTINQKIK